MSCLRDYGSLGCKAVRSGKYVLDLLITQRRIKENPDLVKRKELLLPLRWRQRVFPKHRLPDYTASHTIRAQCVSDLVLHAVFIKSVLNFSQTAARRLRNTAPSD